MSTTETGSALDALRGLSREELLDVFRTLRAPSHAEIDGEFGPWLPDYAAADFEKFLHQNEQDVWYGKAYTLQRFGRWPGQGYNIFQIGPDIVRNQRFAWSIAPSTFDEKPSLVMEYAAFDNHCGVMLLIDEVRKAGDDAFLGVFSTRDPVPLFTPERDPATGRSRHEVFGLVGRRSAWLGPDDPNAEVPA